MSVNLCNVTGTVLNGAGAAFANASITFNSIIPQTVQGSFVPQTTAVATTDVNGNINGGSGINLIQGLFVQVSLTLNGNMYSQFTALVPFVSSVTFGSLASGVISQPTNVITTGTWTPVLSATTTAPTVTYTTQSGYYCAVGPMMTIWALVAWNAQSGGSGSMIVTGQPASTFTGTAFQWAGSSIQVNNISLGGNYQIVPRVGGISPSEVDFVASSTAGAAAIQIPITDIAGASALIFSVSFRTS